MTLLSRLNGHEINCVFAMHIVNTELHNASWNRLCSSEHRPMRVSMLCELIGFKMPICAPFRWFWGQNGGKLELGLYTVLSL